MLYLQLRIKGTLSTINGDELEPCYSPYVLRVANNECNVTKELEQRESPGIDEDCENLAQQCKLLVWQI